MDEETLIRLVNAFCSGNIEAGDFALLDRELAESAAAREVFLRYCQLHGDLTFGVREEQATRRFLRAHEALLGVGDLLGVPEQSSGRPASDEQSAAPQSQASDETLAAASESRGNDPVIIRAVAGKADIGKGKRRLTWGVSAAAACAACLMVAWGLQRMGEAAPPTAERHAVIVGSLADSPTAVWPGAEQPDSNAVFVEGRRLNLLAGEARFSMACGAECAVQGPARIQFLAADRIGLEQGTITATVAPWGTGFTVETDALNVIDLGTSFQVTVDDAKIEANVLEGAVRVRPAEALDSGRSSILLAGGEAVAFDKARRKLMLSSDERSVGPHDELNDLKRTLPFHPINLYSTGRSLRMGDEDPHWRIVAGPPTPDFHEGQYAVVCELDNRYLRNVPDVSQWLSVSANLRPCNYNAVYTFETSFDLTSFDLSTVVIVGQILADNGVNEVRLNGKPIVMDAWLDSKIDQVFHKFHRIEIAEGLQPGLNTIQIDVFNAVVPWHARMNSPEPNPMALRVEWQAFGRRRPEAEEGVEVDARPQNADTPNH
ncbi:MAG: FecR domain-containing protein [Planctomycetales bacterium]|nr:FecR domain-containing protein [Planctomycetales bacterium]